MIFLGDLIRLQRMKNNLTLDQLADKIHYSKSRISRAETINDGKSNASFEMLHSLSHALAFDFISIHKYSNRFSDYLEYTSYFKLKDAISIGTIEPISDFIKDNNLDTSICENKDIYFAKIYAFTLLYKNDSKKSIDLCFSSLNLNLHSIENISLKPYIQEDMLGVYTVLVLNLINIKKVEEAFVLANELYIYFKTYLFNNDSFIEQSFFIKKLYILTINNLAHLQFIKKDYITALNFCNEAIETANTFNISRSLNRIYKLKMELLYLTGDIDSSRIYYEDAKTLSRILNDIDYINTIDAIVTEHYSKILD